MRTRAGVDWLVRELQSNESYRGDLELREELIQLALADEDLEAVPALDEVFDPLLDAAVHQLMTAGDDETTIADFAMQYRYLKEAAGERLSRAAGSGDRSAMANLIKLGADVDWGGGGPLRNAISLLEGEAALRVVEFLLYHGADVNLDADGGENALHVAAWWGKTPLVEPLLVCGANPGARDLEGFTPGDCAAYRGHQETAALLRAALCASAESA